jgi:hypothetical protein
MKFTIKDKVFPVTVTVFINLTAKKTASLMNRKQLPEGSLDLLENPGWVSSADDGCVVIVFNDMSLIPDEKDIAIIAHECCHATFAIFKFIGESASDAEETFCYYTQFLTEKILKKINQKHKNECRKRDNGNKTTHEAPGRSDDGSESEAKQSCDGNKGEQPISDRVSDQVKVVG